MSEQCNTEQLIPVNFDAERIKRLENLVEELGGVSYTKQDEANGPLEIVVRFPSEE
jgi:hypothetical protein